MPAQQTMWVLVVARMVVGEDSVQAVGHAQRGAEGVSGFCLPAGWSWRGGVCRLVGQAVGHWESLRQDCLPLQSVVKEVVECPDCVSWDTLPAGLRNLPELHPLGVHIKKGGTMSLLALAAMEQETAWFWEFDVGL